MMYTLGVFGNTNTIYIYIQIIYEMQTVNIL